ncbi:MAG: bifunctional riboflavin kinase/FAD synthetase, partial [Nodosilinea sp.]
MWITSSLSTAITPTAVALGNFDGIHLGHEAVIRQILPVASLGVGSPPSFTPSLQGFSQPNASAMAGARVDRSGASVPIPTVMTFYPHPQEFFSG